MLNSPYKSVQVLLKVLNSDVWCLMGAESTVLAVKAKVVLLAANRVGDSGATLGIYFGWGYVAEEPLEVPYVVQPVELSRYRTDLLVAKQSRF